MSKTLLDIIAEAKDGNMPTHEECLYAMLAYETMFNIEHRQLREELMREKPQPQFLKDMKLKNSFDMYKGALSMPPREFLGWSNDPKNPEYQKLRQIGNKIFDKITNTD